MGMRNHPPTHRARNVMGESAKYIYWMFIYRMDDGRWKRSYAPGTWNADGTPYYAKKYHRPLDLETVEPLPDGETPNDWPITPD